MTSFVSASILPRESSPSTSFFYQPFLFLFLGNLSLSLHSTDSPTCPLSTSTTSKVSPMLKAFLATSFMSGTSSESRTMVRSTPPTHPLCPSSSVALLFISSLSLSHPIHLASILWHLDNCLILAPNTGALPSSIRSYSFFLFSFPSPPTQHLPSSTPSSPHSTHTSFFLPAALLFNL